MEIKMSLSNFNKLYYTIWRVELLWESIKTICYFLKRGASLPYAGLIRQKHSLGVERGQWK